MSLNSFKKYSSYKAEDKNENLQVWTYTRVSSKEQFLTNNSIDNQTRNAQLCADERSFTISEVFGGTYESGKSDFTRTEFSKLIERVRKAKRKPYAILIFKMSRFSRAGGSAIGLVNELVEILGVHLIEVSTGKDTTTERGKIEIFESLLHARKENIERLEITIPGMIAFLQAGNWLGNVPKGYDHYGPRVKNSEFINGIQRIELNDEGNLLKMAWKWKLAGTSDSEIRRRLTSKGLSISKQFLSAMWRKPFYCGINTNALLKGDVVRGNWPRMVSEKDFLTINKQLEQSTRTGYTHSEYEADRPLQGDLICGECGSKMTGYKAKKKFDYYKCSNSSCKSKDLNAKTGKRSIKEGVNDSFKKILNDFTLKPKYVEAFKAQLKRCISDSAEGNQKLVPILKRKIAELKSKQESLENRFIYDSLSRDLYNKHKMQLTEEILTAQEELAKVSKSTSNLISKVDKCIDTVQNINKTWGSGNIYIKKRIQKAIYPKGIVVSQKKGLHRTYFLNPIFKLATAIAKDTEGQKKDEPSDLPDSSAVVAGTGLEPMTFGL